MCKRARFKWKNLTDWCSEWNCHGDSKKNCGSFSIVALNTGWESVTWDNFIQIYLVLSIKIMSQQAEEASDHEQDVKGLN